MSHSNDFIGEVYRSLTTIGPPIKSPGKHTLQECRCECGKVVTVRREHLLRGAKGSCGCQSSKWISESRRTHGASETPEYNVWTLMRARCSSKSNRRERKHYADRGISVCERWAMFENFLQDMGPRPSADHSIDRIDVNGNYEPGNCRWATKVQQMNNKRHNIRLTCFGVEKLLTEWALEYGIDSKALRQRIRRGWSPERALTQSLVRGKRNLELAS